METDSDGDTCARAGGAPLPASFRAAWGVRERPGKGPKPGLSLDRIVEAGIRVADAEGLPAVSMGRVAKELGVSTMALYRYVAAKDELLALMTDAALGEPLSEPASSADWRTGLSQWAWAELGAYQRHPWATRAPIMWPPHPNQAAWMERGLAVMKDTGILDARKPSVILLISGYTRNWASMLADFEDLARTTGLTATQVTADYGRLMGELIDPARFPALAACIAAGAFDDDVDGDDLTDEFSFGLERILDGIQVLIDRL